jgi:hypothetical protein
LEKYTASVFRIEDGGTLSTLKMEAVFSSETFLPIYQAEDHDMNLHHCENLKSYKSLLCFRLSKVIASRHRKIRLP